MIDLRCFAYFNGRTSVMGDPVRILRGLVVCLQGDPRPVIARARGGDPAPAPGESAADFQARLDEAAVARAVAQTRLADAARVAFDMSPFDPETGQGALDDDCLDVVDQYVEWVAKKKTRPASLPTSASSPELPPFWAQDQEAEESYSESGSTSPD